MTSPWTELGQQLSSAASCDRRNVTGPVISLANGRTTHSYTVWAECRVS